MFIKWLLQQLMNYIIGSNVFGKIQNLVIEVSKEEGLTGKQKKDKVVSELQNLGEDVANHLISLGIEAAVTMIKNKK